LVLKYYKSHILTISLDIKFADWGLGWVCPENQSIRAIWRFVYSENKAISVPLPLLTTMFRITPFSRSALSGLVPNLVALTGLVIGLNPWLPARAVQMADGTVQFINPPSLGDMVTSDKGVGSLSATYAVTVVVPKDADEPLQRVTLSGQGPDQIRFILNRTRAYLGDNRKNVTGIGNVIQDRDTRLVTVVFDPPVPPGQAVTINLYPRHNPWVAGVYLFGVTAFPRGDKSFGQFLGYGRLHFYNQGWWF
jgi:hypothetical protein